MMKHHFVSIPFWIGLFLFSVYLLSFSGKFHVMDELAVFTAGNNLAQHGRADINQLIWTNHWTPNPPGIWGQDGHLYTKKAPGISFITAPLIWLGHRLPNLNAVQVGLLTNAIVTALTASLLFIWLRDLAFSHTASTLTTLSYGLCTIAWIYARMFWESSMLALAFLAAVWAVYRATRLAYARQRLFWIGLSGLAIALGLTLRFETLPAVVFIALYLIWESTIWPMSQWLYARQSRQANETTYRAIISVEGGRVLLSAIPWGRLVIFLTPTLLIALGLLYFNFIRYGNIAETGYSQEFLFEAPWVGGYGLLFSPGRGLFIYAPLMLLLFFGLGPAWRRLSRPYFWLIAALCLFYWLFYGSWFAWGGTWGWGPRFLLPILPLLMLFVAEPIEWAKRQRHKEFQHRKNQDAEASPSSRITHHASPSTLAWLGIGLLVILSLIVNLLGIAVDFNEHFLRLGRNDNFVFNWAVFPPLAHWQILQKGLVDIIWLREDSAGLTIEWAVLTPAFLLFLLSLIGLAITLRNKWLAVRNRWTTHRQLNDPVPSSLYFSAAASANVAPTTHHTSHHVLQFTLYVLLVILLPLALVYETMVGAARLALEDEQTQADMPLLETVSSAAKPNDALLVPMPPFGDVQEVSTLLVGHLDQPLPAATWIETPPRAIQAAERAQLWQATLAEAERVWLFERWLTHTSPTNPTAAYFNKIAFPVSEQWFEHSGKLTLYAVGHHRHNVSPSPLDVSFQGGLVLLDFTLFDPVITTNETIVKLRLTWQAATGSEVAGQGLVLDSLLASVQLLNPDATQNVAQHDRLLLDLQNVDQSPLLPGQSVQQGYGLRLPPDLAPGAYPLVVSLYQASSGQRLRRADDSPDDFLYLTSVVVE